MRRWSFFTQFLLIFLICSATADSPGHCHAAVSDTCALPLPLTQTDEAQSTQPSILVIERDVPQTRNFVPVINHEAMIVNLSEEDLTIDIKSPVPKELYVIGEFYPAFMEMSLLSEPRYYPYEVEISDYTLLDRAAIEENDEEVIFHWRGVRIAPGKAVIAQYDNYFGDVTQFYREDGLALFDLFIHTSYSASFQSGEALFALSYDMENRGKEDMEFVEFRLFFPDITFLGEENAPTKMVEVTELSVSPNVEPYRGFICDGFGNTAEGTIFPVSVGRLKPEEHYKFFVKVKGIKKMERGEIYPLVTVRYRMAGERIWPPTIVSSEKSLEMKNFYYHYPSLVFPDRKLFKLGPKSVEVVESKSVSKPTFSPPPQKETPPEPKE